MQLVFVKFDLDENDEMMYSEYVMRNVILSKISFLGVGPDCEVSWSSVANVVTDKKEDMPGASSSLYEIQKMKNWNVSSVNRDFFKIFNEKIALLFDEFFDKHNEHSDSVHFRANPDAFYYGNTSFFFNIHPNPNLNEDKPQSGVDHFFKAHILVSFDKEYTFETLFCDLMKSLKACDFLFGMGKTPLANCSQGNVSGTMSKKLRKLAPGSVANIILYPSVTLPIEDFKARFEKFQSVWSRTVSNLHPVKHNTLSFNQKITDTLYVAYGSDTFRRRNELANCKNLEPEDRGPFEKHYREFAPLPILDDVNKVLTKVYPGCKWPAEEKVQKLLANLFRSLKETYNMTAEQFCSPTCPQHKLFARKRLPRDLVLTGNRDADIRASLSALNKH